MSDPLLIDRSAAAGLLSITVKHFDRHVAHKLPKVHVGRLVRFRAVDVAAWVDEQAGGGDPARVARRAPVAVPVPAHGNFPADTPRSRRLLQKPRDYGASPAAPLVLSPKAAAMAERIQSPSRGHAPKAQGVPARPPNLYPESNPRI